MTHLKERIKELRKTLELTQEEFGKRIGLVKSGISRIENGTTGTTEQTLRSMCREFGASYLWLTTGEGPMFEKDGDDAALHVMIDRIMASENNRVKQVFKSLVRRYRCVRWCFSRKCKERRINNKMTPRL